MDFALYVELVSFDRNKRLLLSICLHDKAHLGQVRLDLTHCLVYLVDVVILAERFEIVALFEKSALDLKNVEKCRSAELLRVRSQEDVVLSFFGQCVSKLTGSLEVKVFKKGLSELGKAITVDVFFALDDWKCNLGKSVSV